MALMKMAATIGAALGSLVVLLRVDRRGAGYSTSTCLLEEVSGYEVSDTWISTVGTMR